MAHTAKHNSVGAGDTPKLGRGKPEGLAQPGNGKWSASPVPKSSDFGSVGTAARPGGKDSAQRKTTPAGMPPKVARPGSAQGANRGKNS